MNWIASLALAMTGASSYERSLDNLRSLADGKEVLFSAFVSAQGIICQDIQEIEFKDCILRMIDSPTNPGIHTNLVYSTHSDNDGTHQSGAIIEIKYQVKALPLSEGNITCSSGRY